METSTLAGVAAIGVVGFLAMRGDGDAVSGSGGGGAGEEIADALSGDLPGLNITVPDYSGFLEGIINSVNEPTKKAAEIYDSGNDHDFDIGLPSSFDPKGRGLYDVLIPRDAPSKKSSGFGGSYAPSFWDKYFKYSLTPQAGDRSFWTGRVVSESVAPVVQAVTKKSSSRSSGGSSSHSYDIGKPTSVDPKGRGLYTSAKKYTRTDRISKVNYS